MWSETETEKVNRRKPEKSFRSDPKALVRPGKLSPSYKVRPGQGIAPVGPSSWPEDALEPRKPSVLARRRGGPENRVRTKVKAPSKYELHGAFG